jgi:hypothetical protein
MDAKQSDLRLVLALLGGAGLGIAAVAVLGVVAAVVPARFGEPFAKVCFVLVVALILSVVVRLVAAVFSPSIRASIVAHEGAHAVWFGAAIGIVLLVLLLPRAKFKHFFRESPNPVASGNGAMAVRLDGERSCRAVPQPLR